jgi:ABC-type branched-subunit amino acid transport system ATPase component
MTAPDDVLVRAKGLTKQFGDFVAVDGIEIEISRGEAFAFSVRTGPASRPRCA